jgi:hypothetical protein
VPQRERSEHDVDHGHSHKGGGDACMPIDVMCKTGVLADLAQRGSDMR